MRLYVDIGMKRLRAFMQAERGQDIVEYSLLLAFLALATAAVLFSVEQSSRGIWSYNNGMLSQATTVAQSGEIGRAHV